MRIYSLTLFNIFRRGATTIILPSSSFIAISSLLLLSSLFSSLLVLVLVIKDYREDFRKDDILEGLEFIRIRLLNTFLILELLITAFIAA